jgi:copper oxidase (laccase) domain-containing protein
MPGNIHVAELCTKTHAGTFHSYRVRGEKAGRMIGVIRARARN